MTPQELIAAIENTLEKSADWISGDRDTPTGDIVREYSRHTAPTKMREIIAYVRELEAATPRQSQQPRASISTAPNGPAQS
jgi:hypothetical protein